MAKVCRYKSLSGIEVYVSDKPVKSRKGIFHAMNKQPNFAKLPTFVAAPKDFTMPQMTYKYKELKIEDLEKAIREYFYNRSR